MSRRFEEPRVDSRFLYVIPGSPSGKAPFQPDSRRSKLSNFCFNQSFRLCPGCNYVQVSPYCSARFIDILFLNHICHLWLAAEERGRMIKGVNECPKLLAACQRSQTESICQVGPQYIIPTGDHGD